MKINFQNQIMFGRKLNSSEEKEYAEVLSKGKSAVSGGVGRSVLIVPSSSLPQTPSNNTGVSTLCSEDSLKFFDFAKKYWGINEVQILPSGQYFSSNGEYPIYSGTTMDLGNHMIDIKSFISEEDYKKIVDANKINERVNFSNIVEKTSIQEDMLKKLYKNIPSDLQEEFVKYKSENAEILNQKGLYSALKEIHSTHDYKKWGNLDSNLFDDRMISTKEREARIKEIETLKSETIDFYKFKQFLAEKSLKKSKEDLNKRGLKLNGDMPCGFSYDEVWANPKAFRKNCTIGWGLPALDYETSEAEKLLRKKVNIYAKRFDGFRVDASWTYVSPNIRDTHSNILSRPDYGDKFLKIIDDEVKKVKGSDYDLNNITHEFTADYKDFDMFEGGRLKPFIKERTQIYTSEWLKDDWGHTQAYINNGISKDKFILGTSNHDSKEIKYSEEQAEVLGRILKIPKEKLTKYSEFLKAKFAEPMHSLNNMLFFMPALGIKGSFKDDSQKLKNYAVKISDDYEAKYFNSLQKGEAFNPMDALEKQFKAQGLDKTEKELYEKIVKYRKILESKNGLSKTTLGIIFAGIIFVSGILYLRNKTTKEYSQNK